jgi:hypothetical protein
MISPVVLTLPDRCEPRTTETILVIASNCRGKSSIMNPVSRGGHEQLVRIEKRSASERVPAFRQELNIGKLLPRGAADLIGRARQVRELRDNSWVVQEADHLGRQAGRRS